jgi:hypothetical protein
VVNQLRTNLGGRSCLQTYVEGRLATGILNVHYWKADFGCVLQDLAEEFEIAGGNGPMEMRAHAAIVCLLGLKRHCLFLGPASPLFL